MAIRLPTLLILLTALGLYVYFDRSAPPASPPPVVLASPSPTDIRQGDEIQKVSGIKKIEAQACGTEESCGNR